jgi:hypothetical protein
MRDPVVAGGDPLELGDVGAGVGRRPDDDERLQRAAGDDTAQDQVHVVLRLEPGDDEVVATRLEAELPQPVQGGIFQHRCPVGEVVRRRAVPAAVVLLDPTASAMSASAQRTAARSAAR